MIVAVLIAQIAFGLAVMTISLPSMQDWAVQLGVSQAKVQLTFSLYVLAFGAFQLMWGPLSDRHGRRPVMLLGLALLIVGLVLAALAPGANTLIAARFVQGMGAAAGIVAARASMQDLFEGTQRTRVIGYSGMAMGLAPPIATVVGGQLHESVGWQANFVVMAALGTGLLLLAWRVLPRQQRVTTPDTTGSPSTITSPATASSIDASSIDASSIDASSSAAPTRRPAWWLAALRDYARLLRERAFMPSVMVIAFTAASWYAFLGGAPLVLGSYGVGPAQLGWYVMLVPVSYIVGNFLTTRLAHRLSGNRLMLAGQVSAITGIVLMMLLALFGVDVPIAFTLPLMLLGIGHGLVLPSAMVRTVGLVAGLAGAAAAVTGVLQQLVGATSGYVVGLLSHDGPLNLGWMMLVTTLLSLLSLAALLAAAKAKG